MARPRIPPRWIALAASALLAVLLATQALPLVDSIAHWWRCQAAAIEERQAARTQKARILGAYAANQTINTILKDAFDDLSRLADPLARPSRISVGLIHRAEPGIPLLYDTSHMAGALPSNLTPEAFTNVPIAQWQAYMPSFLQRRCAVLRLDDPRADPEATRRLRLRGLQAIVGCPLTSRDGDLLGGVFVVWEQRDAAPDTEEALLRLRRDAAALSAVVPML